MDAIQTNYKGYRFRSRLEARWAVVFDALELDWEYEAEGFELSVGRYLPDFYIKTWDLWVEVKPYWSEGGSLKSQCFAKEKTAIIILAGVPGKHGSMLLCHELVWHWSHDPRVRETYLAWLPIRLMRVQGEPMLVAPEGSNNCFMRTSADTDNTPIQCLHFPETVEDLDEEYAKGRGARFEFGECG